MHCGGDVHDDLYFVLISMLGNHDYGCGYDYDHDYAFLSFSRHGYGLEYYEHENGCDCLFSDVRVVV